MNLGRSSWRNTETSSCRILGKNLRILEEIPEVTLEEVSVVILERILEAIPERTPTRIPEEIPGEVARSQKASKDVPK